MIIIETLEVLTGLLREVLRRRARAFRTLMSRTAIWRVEVLEFALSDLFSDNIDVVREVHLLQELEDEAWQKADNHDQEDDGPEGGLTKNLGRGLVEELGEGFVGGPDAGPEEDEEGGDASQQAHQPIPSGGVEHDVQVDDDYGCDGDVDADAVAVANVLAIGGDEDARGEEEVHHEVTDYRLVCGVEHVEPGNLLADCTKMRTLYTYQNLV